MNESLSCCLLLFDWREKASHVQRLYQEGSQMSKLPYI